LIGARSYALRSLCAAAATVGLFASTVRAQDTSATATGTSTVQSEVQRGWRAGAQCAGFVKQIDLAQQTACLDKAASENAAQEADPAAFELGLDLAGWSFADITSALAVDPTVAAETRTELAGQRFAVERDFLLAQARAMKLGLNDDQILGALFPGPATNADAEGSIQMFRERWTYWRQQEPAMMSAASDRSAPAAMQAALPRNCFEAFDYYSQRVRAAHPDASGPVVADAVAIIMQDVGCRTADASGGP
jgi:hypothetical protein